MLYHLVRGIEDIHAVGECHRDVHGANSLIEPREVCFDLKLIDFYDWGQAASWKQKQGLTNAIGVFIRMSRRSRLLRACLPKSNTSALG